MSITEACYIPRTKSNVQLSLFAGHGGLKTDEEDEGVDNCRKKLKKVGGGYIN